jgi:hypothetical protein
VGAGRAPLTMVAALDEPQERPFHTGGDIPQMDPSALSTDTIKMGGGLGAAIISNLTGIPFDRFRVGVAQVAAPIR